ncbi:hypothetical protein MMC25_005028 [Agyrium rufum]|nr:hypothetical protein [Agyrium rufum]
MWALYLAALLLALPLWSTVALYRNHRRATPIGLPLLISPIDPFNPLWILLRPYVNPLLSCLPYGLGSFTRYDYLGWVWHDKNQLHRIHGPAFVIVTPGQNHLIVGDAAACNDIFKRWREVVKNPAFNDSLNIFGHNVGTAAGNDWQRQRKTTAVAFNEHNNGLVWSEAIKQASQMLSTWVAAGNNGTTSVVEDTNLFALHILTCAGFGLSYDFDSSMNQVAEGHTMTYRDALKTMLGNIFITFAVSSVKIPPFLLPQKAKSILTAIDELKRYMAEMIQAESIAYQNKAAAKSPNLMSTLIRASKQAEQESSNVDKGRNSLTDDEIRGNLFIFNVAGFDTTAGTIAYAIALFACYPQWQEWVREEFVQVFGGAAITDCQYQQCFPQLKRCLAVMVGDDSELWFLNGVHDG